MTFLDNLKLVRFQKELLIFSPLLILYLSIVHFRFNPSLEADGARYLWFANNLLQGYYSPPASDLNLWNGPGYPLVLSLFTLLGSSAYFMALANAVFQFTSVILFYTAIKQITSNRIAFINTLIWALWPFSYIQMTQIMSESFATFLITLILLIVTKSNRMNKLEIILCSLVFAILILTKVIFAYVAVVIIISSLTLVALKKSKAYFQFAKIAVLAIFFTSPYLIYTYNLTGKVFYYSNSGGMSLYWMSSPNKDEFGDWNNINLTSYCWEGATICNEQYFKKNHETFFEKVRGMNPIERDETFKKKAISNITSSPFTYLKNCYANFLRMFFNYPESYSFSRLSTLARIIPGSFLLVLTLISFSLILPRFLRIPPPMQFLVLFFTAYMAGSTALSAYPRMLNIALPILLFLITYAFHSWVRIQLIKLED